MDPSEANSEANVTFDQFIPTPNDVYEYKYIKKVMEAKERRFFHIDKSQFPTSETHHATREIRGVLPKNGDRQRKVSINYSTCLGILPFG